MTNRRKLWMIVLTAILGVSGWARAQNTSGSITGRLVDPSGAVVAGATVTVTETNTGVARSLVSSSDGDFTATLLQPGVYSVSAAMTGFKTEVRTGIVVQVDQTVRTDMTLS